MIDKQHFIKRRDFIKLGIKSGFILGNTTLSSIALNSLASDQLSASPQKATNQAGPAKAVIQIFLPGGIAAQESWDPKYYAPIQYRGPFRAIKTKIEGERFSQHLKKTAQIANELVVIRSMTHGEAAHERGTHNMYTGYRPSPAIQYPSFGSVISHEFGSQNHLPPYVCIPNQPNIFAGTGYLSSAFSPFGLGSDPANKKFKVLDLNLLKGIDAKRHEERKEILNIIDSSNTISSSSDEVLAMESFYEKAYHLIETPKAREAFDLKKESQKLVNEYGNNEAGKRFLMARRLIEYGVRYVNVSYGSWDHHDKIKNKVAKQLPNFDKAFASLIRDLKSRGLLDSTLVVVSTEFGRTPKINKDGGRDHWPKVFSTVLAGGGLNKGLVYGASDATASEPERDPVNIADFASTIYHQLGIDSNKKLMSAGGRPIEIVKGGQAIKELIS